MLKYQPSKLAASAIYLAHKILHGQTVWPLELQNATTYTEAQLKNCSNDMCILLNGIEKCTLQAVRTKFSASRFEGVALVHL